MPDTIGLVFYTGQNLRQERLAQRLLQLYFTFDESFAPEYMSHGNEWRPVTTSEIGALSRDWPRHVNHSLERRSRFASAMAVSMGGAASGYSTANFWLSDEYFHFPSNTQRFLYFSDAIYELLSPAYGYIHPTRDVLSMSTIQDPRYGRTLVPVNLKKGLPGVYWGNYFGPKYVGLIGKPTLMKTSVVGKTELSDGGVLLVTTSTPLEPKHTIQTQVKSEIGDEYFYEWGRTTSAKVP
jgi:hypothetical protein